MCNKVEKSKFLNFRGRLVEIKTPMVMGIINLTPDSFYSESRNLDIDICLNNIEKMIQEGADIIDIGAYSSRPGATNISIKEELNRIEEIHRIVESFPDVLISIDTFRSQVAKSALEQGVHLVNDISGGELDSNMYKTVGEYDAPYILMHMKGNPQTMKSETNYKDIIGEMTFYFSEKINQLKAAGVNDIILDPGFGFAKNIEQNYLVLKELNSFKVLNCPILAGLSRKSMIYKLLESTPEKALNGTTALNMLALQNGANILRVHDVKEAKDCINLFEQYSQQ